VPTMRSCDDIGDAAAAAGSLCMHSRMAHASTAWLNCLPQRQCLQVLLQLAFEAAAFASATAAAAEGSIVIRGRRCPAMPFTRILA
jgi:hypothetical protein